MLSNLLSSCGAAVSRPFRNVGVTRPSSTGSRPVESDPVTIDSMWACMVGAWQNDASCVVAVRVAKMKRRHVAVYRMVKSFVWSSMAGRMRRHCRNSDKEDIGRRKLTLVGRLPVNIWTVSARVFTNDVHYMYHPGGCSR